MDKRFAIKARVIRNELMAGNYFEMVLHAPQIAASARPGQFFMVHHNDLTDCFLTGTPLAIADCSRQTISAFYHVVGHETRLLSCTNPESYLPVTGPLGNGFDLTMAMSDRKVKVMMVAGGCGVAPLYLLIKRFCGLGHDVEVYYGVKSETDLFLMNKIRETGAAIYVATMDGSMGYHGIITDLLLSHLKSDDFETSHEFIFASGPDPMLKVLATIAGRLDIAAEVSLEAYMACGIGACHGCVIKTKTGYQRCCVEGPVFDIHQVV